jgi:glucose/arabinose dehydrogenase
LLWFNIEERSKVTVKGVPEVAYGGQGGLGDIILHPQYEDNQPLHHQA